MFYIFQRHREYFIKAFKFFIVRPSHSKDMPILNMYLLIGLTTVFQLQA